MQKQRARAKKDVGEMAVIKKAGRRCYNQRGKGQRQMGRIQSNLPIVDMLYSGQLAIAECFSWNGPNHGQTLIEKPLYSGHVYSGQLL